MTINVSLDPADAGSDAPILSHLRDTLQNSVDKLRQSNKQLQAALDSGDKDPEYRQAIGVRTYTITVCFARASNMQQQT